MFKVGDRLSAHEGARKWVFCTVQAVRSNGSYSVHEVGQILAQPTTLADGTKAYPVWPKWMVKECFRVISKKGEYTITHQGKRKKTKGKFSHFNYNTQHFELIG